MKYHITYKHPHEKDPFMKLWDDWSLHLWNSLNYDEKQGGTIENKLMLKLRNQLIFNFNYRVLDEI